MFQLVDVLSTLCIEALSGTTDMGLGHFSHISYNDLVIHAFALVALQSETFRRFDGPRM